MGKSREYQQQQWLKNRQYSLEQISLARVVLEEIKAGKQVTDAVRRHPLPNGGYLAKHALVATYRNLVNNGEWESDPTFLETIRMKPIRTLSGVTTVTVLTKPYPCPGKCIFCPTDVRMPKSYLPDEPGARRALQYEFDPYDQVAGRIEALHAVGHPTDKVEILVLGGTWSAYRRDYQEWFIRRSFDALNGIESNSLYEAHLINESSDHRNVGLVIETRPDHIDRDEIRWLRKLGVTKVQIGLQSLDDRILELNQRGHSLADTHKAIALLRAAGFKTVVHWMPNLLGATPESDKADFGRLWKGICPDELKIYPNQLLENAELYLYWLRGEYTPYTSEQLVELIADLKPSIPRYCRVNRVIRDIPSTNVVAGNKRTSLRQDIHKELQRRGTLCSCIRCREVRKEPVDIQDLSFNDLVYLTGTSEEHFLSFDTKADRLAGFLRLSIPVEGSPDTGLEDLKGAAIIREVHVFGQSIPLGNEANGAAQHIGLGRKLIREAERITIESGFSRLAVISAVGTRQYYLNLGFQRRENYLVKELLP